jgi:hypothetical protein
LKVHLSVETAVRAAAVGLAVLSAGCATIGLEAPVTHDQRLKSFHIEVPLEGEAVVEVEQVGTDVVLDAKKTCRVEDRRSVRRTTTQERTNAAPGVDWVYGIAGGVATGLGTGVIVDAQLNVAPTQQISQSYNPIGPTNATLIGVALAAAGVGMLVVPIVDATRASGSEEKVDVLDLKGEVIEARKPCFKGALESKVVTGRFMIARRTKYEHVDEPKSVDLGTTNGDGQLEIDLTDAATDADPSANASDMTLLIDGVEVGKVDLTPLFHKWEAAAWEGLDRQRCFLPSLS